MDTTPRQHVIFIAGAGQASDAWHAVAALLPTNYEPHFFVATALTLPGESFSINGSADALSRYMTDNVIDAAHFVGLSLGAMIATAVALRHPGQVSSLVLCGSQVRPNKFLMGLQSTIMNLLPEKLLGLPPELSKKQLLAILDESAKTDVTTELPTIACQVLVVCGAKDTPNLSAARYLAAHLPKAQLHVLKGAGHQLNTTHVTECSELLNHFLATR